ncbi:MAG: helix-turn-helix domain-containing protein [Wolinella sp.]
MKESEKVLAYMRLMAGTKTDKELSDILGINYRTLDNWRVRGYIPDKRLREFAEYFNVSVEFLTSGGKAPVSLKNVGNKAIEINMSPSINGDNNNQVLGDNIVLPSTYGAKDNKDFAELVELLRRYGNPKIFSDLKTKLLKIKELS